MCTHEAPITKNVEEVKDVAARRESEWVSEWLSALRQVGIWGHFHGETNSSNSADSSIIIPPYLSYYIYLLSHLYSPYYFIYPIRTTGADSRTTHMNHLPPLFSSFIKLQNIEITRVISLIKSIDIPQLKYNTSILTMRYDLITADQEVGVFKMKLIPLA